MPVLPNPTTTQFQLDATKSGTKIKHKYFLERIVIAS